MIVKVSALIGISYLTRSLFAKASHMGRPDVRGVGCLLLVYGEHSEKASVGMDMVDRDRKYLEL